jgi:hypothetical protein
MTEAEWLDCTDLQKMLEFLRGKASDRKLRLFAVAETRRVWHLLTDVRSREAVHVAERYADGRATLEDRLNAVRAAHAAKDAAAHECPGSPAYVAARMAYHAASCINGDAAAANAALDASKTFSITNCKNVEKVHLVSCLFGNPFRPVTLEQSWLSWNEGTVVKLAQTIFSDRAFDRLPIVADALEEAGCHDANILAHCRGPGPHVLGCFVLDAFLGKT